MELKILSVAEDGYESDRITAIQKNYHLVANDRRLKGEWRSLTYVKELRISISNKKSLTVEEFRDGRLNAAITIDKIDLNGLIEYLQEVKTFVSEEELVAKLMGKKL